jgi:immunoglobulin-binding protein 1
VLLCLLLCLQGGGECGGPGCWDEEDERQLWVMQLEAAALRALDALPLLEQELALLRRAAEAAQQPGSSQQEQQQGGGASSSNGRQVQQAMMQRLADVASQLSLGQDRQAMAQQVLRPGHILPTLTVEQQGMIELREAQQRGAQEKEAAAKAAAAAADTGRNSEDADEERVAKQRAWDDFADDNPRGWGNSKLRPCA